MTTNTIDNDTYLDFVSLQLSNSYGLEWPDPFVAGRLLIGDYIKVPAQDSHGWRKTNRDVALFARKL